MLFAVEIWWFTVLPVYQELRTWFRRRKQFRFNVALVRTLLIILFFVLILIIPWNSRLTAPAILSAVHEQNVFSPAPSIVLAEPSREKQAVHTGDVLIHLISPELQNKIDRIGISESVSRWQVEQQPFDERILNQGMVPQRRLEASGTELLGNIREKDRLIIRASVDGAILSRNDEIQPGVFLPAKEQLYVVVDTRENRIDAFVGDSDLKRIRIGNRARFIPDALEYGTFDCRVADIDRVNLPFLEEPSLASTYGGPIATRLDPQGRLYPSSTLFRVRFNECSPKHVPALRLRGSICIEAERSISLVDALRRVYNTLIRESGF
jgi:putative peptide zinc metalloprotease protein